MLEPPPPLSDGDRQVNPILERFVMRTLAKKPDERYATPDATLEAIAKIPFNAAAAELELSRHAQTSVTARKKLEPRSVSKDPDAPKMLVAQPGVPVTSAPKVISLPQKAPDGKVALPPTMETERPAPLEPPVKDKERERAK